MTADRLPIGPLLAEAARRGISAKTIETEQHLSVRNAKRNGLELGVADELALYIGCMPQDIWDDDWWNLPEPPPAACRAGHLRDERNTHHAPDGTLRCRTCDNKRHQRYRQQRKQQEAA